jgi:hypothetical protein
LPLLDTENDQPADSRVAPSSHTNGTVVHTIQSTQTNQNYQQQQQHEQSEYHTEDGMKSSNEATPNLTKLVDDSKTTARSIAEFDKNVRDCLDSPLLNNFINRVFAVDEVRTACQVVTQRLEHNSEDHARWLASDMYTVFYTQFLDETLNEFFTSSAGSPDLAALETRLEYIDYNTLMWCERDGVTLCFVGEHHTIHLGSQRLGFSTTLSSKISETTIHLVLQALARCLLHDAPGIVADGLTVHIPLPSEVNPLHVALGVTTICLAATSYRLIRDRTRHHGYDGAYDYARSAVVRAVVRDFVRENPQYSPAKARLYLQNSASIVLDLVTLVGGKCALTPTQFIGLVSRRFVDGTSSVANVMFLAVAWLFTVQFYKEKADALNQPIKADAWKDMPTKASVEKEFAELAGLIPVQHRRRLYAALDCYKQYDKDTNRRGGGVFMKSIKDVLTIGALLKLVEHFIRQVSSCTPQAAEIILAKAQRLVTRQDVVNKNKPITCECYVEMHELYLDAARARLLYSDTFAKSAAWNKLTKYIEEFDMAGFMSKDTEMPFGVRLFGKGNTGKSFLKSTIEQMLLLHYDYDLKTGVFPMRDPTAPDSYASGYTTQPIAELDDVVHSGGAEQLTLNRSFLMSFVNNTPMVSQQAEIERKGKRPFHFKAVLMVSNYTRLPIPEVLSEPTLAAYRRFKHYEVKSDVNDLDNGFEITEVLYAWQNGTLTARNGITFIDRPTFLRHLMEQVQAHEELEHRRMDHVNATYSSVDELIEAQRHGQPIQTDAERRLPMYIPGGMTLDDYMLYLQSVNPPLYERYASNNPRTHVGPDGEVHYSVAIPDNVEGPEPDSVSIASLSTVGTSASRAGTDPVLAERTKLALEEWATESSASSSYDPYLPEWFQGCHCWFSSVKHLAAKQVAHYFPLILGDDLEFTDVFLNLAKYTTMILAAFKVKDLLFGGSVDDVEILDTAEEFDTPAVTDSRRGNNVRSRGGLNRHANKFAKFTTDAASSELRLASFQLEYHVNGTCSKTIFAVATTRGFLLPYHFSELYASSEDTSRDLVYITNGNKIVKEAARSFFANAVSWVEHDLLLIPFPRSMSEFPNVIKLNRLHFVDDHEVSPATTFQGSLLNYKSHIPATYARTPAELTSVRYNGETPQDTYNLAHTYEYFTHLPRGSCGTMLTCGGLVAGIHVAIHSATNHGYGRCVTFEIVEEMYKFSKTTERGTSQYAIMSKMLEQHDVHYRPCTSIGSDKVQYTQSVPWTSHVCPLLSTSQLKKTTTPAIRTPTKQEDGSLTTPFSYACETVLNARDKALTSYPDIVRAGSILAEIDGHKYDDLDYRLATVAEALGLDDTSLITPVDMTKSAGFNRHQCHTRRDCIDKEETTSAIMKEVENLVARLAKPNLTEAQIATIAHDLGTYIGSVKSECIKQSKMARVFFPGPLAMFVIMRMYLGPLFKFESLWPLVFRYGPGLSIKKHGVSMHEELSDAMCVGLDYKTWDKLVPADFLIATGEYYGDVVYRLSGVEKHRIIVRNLFRTMLCSTRSFGCVELECYLVASGLPGTTSINGVMNRLLTSVIVHIVENGGKTAFPHEITRVNGLRTVRFPTLSTRAALENILLATAKTSFNGDDGIHPTENPDKWSTGIRQVVHMLNTIFGIKVTGDAKDATPCAVPLDQASFSSRSFHLSELELGGKKTKVAIRPLKEASTWSIGKHYRSKNPPDVTLPSASTSAMLEAAFHYQVAVDLQDEEQMDFYQSFYNAHAKIANNNTPILQMLHDFYETSVYDALVDDEPYLADAGPGDVELSEKRPVDVFSDRVAPITSTITALNPVDSLKAPKGFASAAVTSISEGARSAGFSRIADVGQAISYGLSALGLGKPVKNTTDQDRCGYVVSNQTKLCSAQDGATLNMGDGSLYLSHLQPDITAIASLGERVSWVDTFTLPLNSGPGTTLIDNLAIHPGQCEVAFSGLSRDITMSPAGMALCAARAWTCDAAEVILFIPAGALLNGKLLLSASASNVPGNMLDPSNFAATTVKREIDLSKDTLFKFRVPWMSPYPTKRKTYIANHTSDPSTGGIEPHLAMFSLNLVTLQRISTPEPTSHAVPCKLGIRYIGLRAFGRNNRYMQKSAPGYTADAGGPDDTFDQEGPSTMNRTAGIYSRQLQVGQPDDMEVVPALNNRELLLDVVSVATAPVVRVYDLVDIFELEIVRRWLSYYRVFNYDSLDFRVEVVGGPTATGYVRALVAPVPKVWNTFLDFPTIATGFYDSSFIPISGSHSVDFSTPWVGPYAVSLVNAPSGPLETQWRDVFGYGFYLDAQEAHIYDGTNQNYEISIFVTMRNIRVGIPDTLLADAGHGDGNADGDFETRMGAAGQSYRDMPAPVTVPVARTTAPPEMIGTLYGDEMLNMISIGSIMTPLAGLPPGQSSVPVYANARMTVSHDLSRGMDHNRNWAQFVSLFYAFGRGPLVFTVGTQLNGSAELPIMCTAANYPYADAPFNISTSADTPDLISQFGDGAIVANPRFSSMMTVVSPPYYDSVWKVVPQASVQTLQRIIPSVIPGLVIDWQYDRPDQDHIGTPFVGVAFADGYSLAGLRHATINMLGADFGQLYAEAAAHEYVFTSLP